MTLTTHTLIGVAIVSNIKNPYLSLPLVFLSHFWADVIPHWDYISLSKFPRLEKQERRKLWRYIFFDFIFGLFVGLFFVFRALPNLSEAKIIFFGTLLANLPDGLEFPHLLGVSYPGLGRLINFQKRIQNKTSLFTSILIQLSLALICFFSSL